MCDLMTKSPTEDSSGVVPNPSLGPNECTVIQENIEYLNFCLCEMKIEKTRRKARKKTNNTTNKQGK